jgi:hypothetical protein
MAVSGGGFSVSPWLTLKWDGLELYNAVHYDQSQLNGSLPMLGGDNTFWSGDLVAESILSFSAGPFTLKERILYDTDAAEYLEDLSVEFEAGNVAAKFNTFAVYDPGVPFLMMNGSFAYHVLADAWVKVNQLFGVADLFVGGVEARYLRLQSLFWDEDPLASLFSVPPLAFIARPVFASQSKTIGLAQSRINPALFGIGANPWIIDPNELLVSKSVGLGALDIYMAEKVPFAGLVSLREWFRTNNLLIGARYALGDSVVIDGGWDIGIGYKEDYAFVAAVNYKDYREGSLGNNRFWLDASLDLVEGLGLLTGLDFTLRGFRDLDGTTGAGTPADPTVYSYKSAWISNLGIEAIYDMGSVVSGLSLEAGLYLALWGGKTWDTVNGGAQTFAQFLDANYPTANFYRMKSLSEQAYLNNPILAGTTQYDGLYPFQCYLGASYALNEAWSLRFADQFTANSNVIDTTYFGTAPTPAIGYASSNILELGARYREGNAELSVDFGWIALVGLPSAADLGYTDAIAQANGYATAKDIYRDEGPFLTNPFLFKFGLKIEL